jgi:hypothetical protein
MKVKDIAAAVEKITPLGLAQPWDNVGLLIGDPEQNVRNVLLTIDVTQAVVAEAKELETDLILSYRHLGWLKKIRTDAASKRLNHRSGISVSPSTQPWARVGAGQRQPRRIWAFRMPYRRLRQCPAEMHKFMVFVPVDAGRWPTRLAEAGPAGSLPNCWPEGRPSALEGHISQRKAEKVHRPGRLLCRRARSGGRERHEKGSSVRSAGL